ncbi:MAG: hypothetical protein ACFFDM_12490 [Candidatus Thorarchaeota archaeon]
MQRSPSRLLLLGFMTLFIVFMIAGNITTVDAQFPDENWINDEQDRLHVYIVLGGEIIKQHNLSNPITLDMNDPMPLYMMINATGTQTLNMSGSITFWYQGIAIFPIQIVDPDTNSTWVLVDPSSSIPPIEAEIDFSQMLSLGPISLTTGVFEATVDFQYYTEGNTTVNLAQHRFSFLIPSDPYSVITSVTGISAVVATIGAVTGLGQSIFALWDGLKTAYKLRGIHKKASELRSLPNLTVLSSLPLLFSMLDNMKKKKKEGRDDSGVSEYIVRQRLREVAPDAWQADNCPRCKRKWNKKIDMCKKCNLSNDDARSEYADLLASKVPAAIRWLGKKKSSDVKTLAKKTKSTQYNAGVIAAAMVDTEVTEITKVGTPLRSFVFNIAGLAFLVITWQQLLGDNTSNWQTSITLIGAAMSLAIIVALYVSRKAQIEKFVADQEEGKKMLPTQEEALAEAEEKYVESVGEPDLAESTPEHESAYEKEDESPAEFPGESEDEIDDYSDEESEEFYSNDE